MYFIKIDIFVIKIRSLSRENRHLSSKRQICIKVDIYLVKLVDALAEEERFILEKNIYFANKTSFSCNNLFYSHKKTSFS